MKIQIEIGSFGSERVTSEHNMTKMEGVASLRLSWKYSVREAKQRQSVETGGSRRPKKALTEKRETWVQNSCKDLVT